MQKAYSVAQINSYIKNMFAADYLLTSVSVKGEISNCKYHSSGHIYFTLKDKLSVLACVMFAGNRVNGLSFPLKEGMQVVVSGNIDVYERDGKYQLYAKKITQDGIGELYEKFEKLKVELEERGLFAKEYKQPIPAIVKTLGVVTAPTGAAVRDIISIAKTRNPYINIVVYPALVQGEGSAPSIVKGIKALEEYGVDVMIVGRGGGSLEDLWAFNEEIVAQAIFDCQVPIISAVGHETDTTIADFVADVRAETPSAGAQIAVCEIGRIIDSIDSSKNRMYQIMMNAIDRSRSDIKLKKSEINRLSPVSKLKDKRVRTMQCEEELKQRMLSLLETRKHELSLKASRLHGVSPLEKLNQGYSYVSNDNNENIKSISQVKEKDSMTIFVSDGIISATVDEIKGVKYE